MKRWIVGGLLGLLAVVMLVPLAAWLWLRASLPALDGEQPLAGLESPVTITRDARGVATVRAGSSLDLARATGFVHAQERFFQMDLLRRSAAGEISALVGGAALEFDKARRMHGMRDVAQRVVASLPDDQQRLLDAYADGVNAGLAALGARPFEYGVLRVAPDAWHIEDSILVIFAMYFDLHDETARRERHLAALHEVFPEALVAFLVPPGTSWDAPLQGEPLGAVPLPGAEVFDFRNTDPALAGLDHDRLAAEADTMPGSNNWAVSGALTADGRPLVANDMHLGLGLPNTWFRLRLELDAVDGYAVTGVSLPGLPAIVAGSNGHIAWGFTNSYGDWVDLVRLETEGCVSGYRTPAGCEAFETVQTAIDVAHAPAEPFAYRTSRWGPVFVEPMTDGEVLYALRWTAHEPAATNLDLRRFSRAQTVDEAIQAAHGAGMPPQNLVVADAAGNIGWTIIGRIPLRPGNGQSPVPSSQATELWAGWLGSSQYPVAVNPVHGRIWTANARVVNGESLRWLGDGGYALGARAGQIRDRLFEKNVFTPQDMLAVQLDDDARFLERWRALLMQILDQPALDEYPARAELRDAVVNWEGEASVDAIGYRLVHAFRADVFTEVFDGLAKPVVARFPEFRFDTFPQSEGPLWTLVTRQPEHLLPPGHADWRSLLLGAVDRVIDEHDAGGVFAPRNWGERNRVVLRHPLGQLPIIAGLVNAEPRELPGGSHMPRVQSASFGASERFAVAPGNEGAGYFHMPGGQSGHPLSPFYLAGNRDWEDGKPAPFLPGETRHTLTLLPGTSP